MTATTARTGPPLKQSSKVALLLIDVISDFEFVDGDELLNRTRPIVGKLAKLRERAKRAGVAVIFVNDNFGRWKEDFRSIVDDFSKPEAKGREVVEVIKPEPDDYYVLKPHRSAFYSTSLMLLLEKLGARKLILTGVTTDICILFSANDAYMRGFDLHVPADCVAAVTEKYDREALGMIERVLKADTRTSDKIRFDRL